MTCYLLHFDQPYRHAQHYLGYTAGPAEVRYHEHCTNSDVKLVAAVRRAGIGIQLARVWPEAEREFEQRHKYREGKGGRHRFGATHSLRPFCPICKAAKAGPRV